MGKPIISRDAFEKNSDGTWTCIKNTDIKNEGNIIRLAPGITFKPDRPQWGVDVVELLEQEDPDSIAG